MQEMTTGRRQLHNRNRSLWQFVLLLAILAVVTITLVVTCFFQFIHHSDYEISLFQGLISEAQSTGSTAKGSASKTTGKNLKDFDFKVSDDETVWSTNTEIELFQASYKNANGDVTVRSADGKSVIAPGTGGNYTFSLKNAGKLNSNYQVWLSADMNVSSSDFPIEFRMSGPKGWVTDSDGAWKTADELNDAVAHKNLYSGKSDEYTLYWRWVFERNADTEDTSYGNMTVAQNGSSGVAAGGTAQISQTISCKVTLHTLAVQGLIGEDTDSVTNTPKPDDRGTTDNKKTEDTETEYKGATDSNGSGAASSQKTAASHSGAAAKKKSAKTGDTTPLWSWILVFVMAGAVSVIILVFRKKNEKKESASCRSDGKE